MGEVSTTRSVNLPGYADTLTASYGAQTLQAFGEASYRFDLGGLQLEPFVNRAYVNLSTDAYNETGGAGSMSSLFSTLGLRAQTEVAFGDSTAVLSGMVGWQHAFGDVLPSASHAFAGSSDFTVFGLPVAQDTLVLDLGATIDLGPSTELGLSYGGQFGSGFSDHSLSANVTMRF